MTTRGRYVRSTVLVGALLGLIGLPLVVMAADAKVEAAYQRRFQELPANDVDKHLELAFWCRDQEAWDLLLRQCKYLLGLKPDLAQAKLLAKLAKTKLNIDDPDDEEGETPGRRAPSAPSVGGVKPLTDEQVQILRRKELKVRGLERVKVVFRNDVLQRFWEQYATVQTVTRQDQAVFARYSDVQKAQFMLGAMRNPAIDPALAKDIEITNDPAVFVEFKRKVLPHVRKGCATTECHGGDDARGFRLYSDRVLSTSQEYTNYLILHEYAKSGEPMIDRESPDKSLLLQYGLGADGTGHQVFFRSMRDVRYAAILNWIKKLGTPVPDYGFSLERAEKTRRKQGDNP